MCKTVIKGFNSHRCLLKNGSSLLSRIDSIIQSIPLCIQLLILYFIFIFENFIQNELYQKPCVRHKPVVVLQIANAPMYEVTRFVSA